MFSSCIIESSDTAETDYLPNVIDMKSAFSVLPYNRSARIYFEAKSENAIYQWYESSDGLTENALPINGANEKFFITPRFTKNDCKFFYCIASDGAESVTSPVYCVAYTALPLLWIDTVDDEEPYGEGMNCTAGGGNYGYALINTTKVPARMCIYTDKNYDSMYDSGAWEEGKQGLTIKLRGNTSAGVNENGPRNVKHPYKIKLQKKADLLSKTGVTGREEKSYRDKNWILLKDGTSLNTFVGMKVSDFAGTTWTPEFAFVNVMMNGSYRGCYLLIEAISRSEKRADVAEDGWIIERDAYWYNEEVKFTTTLNQKYTFKYPDDDDITVKQLLYIQNFMNDVEASVQDGTYQDFIDAESFARWQLIHDILGTWDSAGSNIYITKYDSTDKSRLVMSSPWDFDSNYRMEDKWSNQHGGTRIYEKWLFASKNTAFLDSYKSQWVSLSPVLWSKLSPELLLLESSIGSDINFSRKLETFKWNGLNASCTTVEQDIATAEEWFSKRVPWLDIQIGSLQ